MLKVVVDVMGTAVAKCSGYRTIESIANDTNTTIESLQDTWATWIVTTKWMGERTPIDPGTEYGLPILPPLLKLVHSSLG
jgi:hypothetical protein